MAAYEYIALTQSGDEKKGILEADTQRQARDQLRNQNLILISLIQVGAKSSSSETDNTSRIQPRRTKMNSSEMVLFTRQLAIMLGSGITIEESLRGVLEETDKKNIKQVISTLRSSVREGQMFATSLDQFPKIFNNMYRATVRAGESSGNLDTVLEQLADYSEKQQNIRKKLQQATIYPLVMLIVCLGIVSFLLVYVVPQLVSVFSQQHQSLPLVTIIVIGLSDWLQSYGLISLGILALLITYFKWQMRKESFKVKVDTFMLKLPVIGRTIRIVNTARYARTFGILFSAGLPVLDSMRASANVVSSLPIKYRLNQATKAVKEGISIHKALKATGVFPPMSLHLIASGEVSGQLNKMLSKSATVQDMEVEGLINTVMALFEPAITIFMGLIIGTVVIAVLLPVFNMSQLVH